MSIPFKKITVIGVGLIGGSLCAALKALEDAPFVRGTGPHQSTLDSALACGVLDEGLVKDDPRVDEWLSAGSSDLVVIATPVSAAREWFERLEACGYDGVITDVASTKSVICDIADEVLTCTARYLPGHPMAGSEANGFSAARADLFQGAYWMLCPDDNTDDEAFLGLHETFSAIGARIISIDRADHDGAVAIVSHVPHIVASSLVELAAHHAGQRKEILRLAAGGFKDTTRIAAGSPKLWCGIAMDNRDAVVSGLAEMRDILGQFEEVIRDENATSLTGLLAESAEIRRSLPATWIPDSANLVEVRIPMSDHPGIIAEVTGFAAHAGCNIESIEIDHISEARAVLVLVLTDEGDIGRFGSALIDDHYDFSLRNLQEE